MLGIVVLPGLTGTGELLTDFVRALGTEFQITVVSYPSAHPLDYAELERAARAALPANYPFIVVGESFSGPIALSLAASPPNGLRAVVLSTSFARYPVRIFSALAWLIEIVPMRAVPLSILSWLLLGRWSNLRHRDALKHVLSRVAPAVLRARAKAALRVDVSHQLSNIKVLLLYLRATHDRLVPSAAGEQVLRAVQSATLSEIEGPHFLLQVRAETCAREVTQFAHGVLSGPH